MKAPSRTRREGRDAQPARPPACACDARVRVARGFTLLEVLAATAITAVLALFMVGILSNVSGFWSRNSGRLGAEAQARYVLDQLTLDLQGALFRDDGNVWLAATVLDGTGNSGLWDTRGATLGALKPAAAPGTSLSYLDPRIGQAVFGQAGVWLRLFTHQRGSNANADTLSAPVAVGWQIVRRASSALPTSTDRRYFLHRAEVTPARTLAAGFNLTAAAYTTGGAGNSGALGEPRSVRAPQDPNTIIAENVVDFGVRFFVHPREGTTALTRIFPANNERTHLASTPPGVGSRQTQFPEMAEVMVRILTDEGARLLAAFEANPQRVARPGNVASDAQYWWQLVLANSQVYTRRIVLPGRTS